MSPYVRSSKHVNVTRSKKTELLRLIIEYITSKDFQKFQQAGLIPATVLQSLGFLESDLEALLYQSPSRLLALSLDPLHELGSSEE